jgi:AcrR family transcriptional regulator
MEAGVGQVTMRRIALAVGVSPTALYVYFPDKDAILHAIAEAWFAELLDVAAASQRPEDSPADRVRACLRAYVGFGLARPDAYRLTFLSPAATRIGSKTCGKIPAAEHTFGVLQRGVEAMIQAGQLHTGPTGPTAEAIWACMHGVTMLLLDQSEHVTTPPEQLIQTVLDIVMNGMR